MKNVEDSNELLFTQIESMAYSIRNLNWEFFKKYFINCF